MIFNKKEYVTREEYENLYERLEQCISYSEHLAKAINVLYKSFESILPPERLKILRKSKIEEIFDAE
jgi:hypothetical protein